MNGTTPIVPNHATAIMGENWSGWHWLSINPHGQVVMWLLYRVDGQQGATTVSFSKREHFEQYIDGIGYEEK